MSLLGRLFGRSVTAPAAPPPPIAPPPPVAAPPAPPPVAPPNSVVVPDDLVAALTADGRSLPDAVEAALREHLSPPAPVAPAPPPAPDPPAPTPEAGLPSPAATATEERVPFWLTREQREPGIEEELRDRLERRRASEADRGRNRPSDADTPEE